MLLATLLVYPLLLFVFAISAAGGGTGTVIFIFGGPAIAWAFVAAVMVWQWWGGELLGAPPAGSYCAVCGSASRPGGRYCPSCGAPAGQ